MVFVLNIAKSFNSKLGLCLSIDGPHDLAVLTSPGETTINFRGLLFSFVTDLKFSSSLWIAGSRSSRFH